MAISGGTQALVDAAAKKYGWPAKDFAAAVNYTYLAPTVTVTDAGTHHSHVVIANMFGRISIDYGDGTVVVGDPDSAGALTPTDHLYGSAGAKTVKVTAYGAYKTGTVTLA